MVVVRAGMVGFARCGDDGSKCGGDGTRCGVDGTKRGSGGGRRGGVACDVGATC